MRFWTAVDWAARFHFLWGIVGTLVTLFAASVQGWGDPVEIWVASVVVGVGIAFISYVIHLWRSRGCVQKIAVGTLPSQSEARERAALDLRPTDMRRR